MFLSHLITQSIIQVSTKQSEIGIGQTYFALYIYEMVDYLHFMYEHEYFLASRKPQQIASYDTIVHPFDIYVWGFTFTTIIAQFILLLITQNLWSYATGKPNPQDYIFQGFFSKKLLPTRTYFKLKHFQIFSSQQNLYLREDLTAGLRGKGSKQERY